MAASCLVSLLLCVVTVNAGLFDNVYDVINTAGKFIYNVDDHVKEVVRQIRTVSNFIDDTIEEECVYVCPDGSKPKTNKSHISIPNGCGTFGLQIPDDKLPVSELRHCCDVHDNCYDTCNSDKEKCDKEFRRCLYKICDKYKKVIGKDLFTGCKAAAQAMFSGTMAFGCSAYKTSQKNACLCSKRLDL